MRGGGDVGEAQSFAGEPRPRLRQMRDIGEVVAEVLVPGPDRLDIGRAAARREAAIDLLVDEIGRYLVVQLAVEPVDEAPRLRAGKRIAGKRPESAAAIAS